MLAHHELLQRAPAVVEHDSLRAIFAADPLPERVVTIEHDDFIWSHAQGVDLAHQHGAQSGEKEGRIRHVAEFVGMRVMRVGHGIYGLQFAGCNQVNAIQVRNRLGDPAFHAFVKGGTNGIGEEVGRGGTETQQQRRAKTGSRGLKGVNELDHVALDFVEVGDSGMAEAHPIFQAHEDGVDTVAIGTKQAAGVKQLLKDLVVRGKLDFVVPAQLLQPKGQRFPDSLGRESCR